MARVERGFTLIELITVVILISVVSVTLFTRLGSINASNVQASRDDLIAALFFAQQTAMARSGVSLIVSATSIDVRENGTSIKIDSKAYPLNFSSAVTAIPITFVYDKLGRTTAGTIQLTSSGGSATITVETSGYAH